MIKQKANLIVIAKTTNNIEDYLNFKNCRNAINKKIKENKIKYYNSKLGDFIKTKSSKYDPSLIIDTPMSHSKQMWTTVKKFTNTNKGSTPESIHYKGNFFNKPKDIANIASIFFKEKIRNIQKNFRETNFGPMDILNALIPRSKNQFKLPLMTINDTIKIINKSKNSWSTCDDDIAMNILKKIKYKIAPHITHLNNSIINSGIYPKRLKISKIIPTKNLEKTKMI